MCCSSYVNHSCAPNCVAEVVTFDKEDKIIIISSRRIPKGEEVRILHGRQNSVFFYYLYHVHVLHRSLNKCFFCSLSICPVPNDA